MEYLSASDLERFGYCPLSWWLSRETEVTSEALEEGERKHDKIAKDLVSLREREDRAAGWERAVIWFSIVATALALIGLSFMEIDDPLDWSIILGLVSIPWLISAVYLMIHSAGVEGGERVYYERLITLFAVIAMIIAISSITILDVDQDVAVIIEILALVWLIAACIAMYRSHSIGQKVEDDKGEMSIEGKIRYVGRQESRLLKSDRYGISGRPDYILETDGEQIPVEVKTGRKPKGPLFSHILQLAAYCLLIEEDTGKRPSHGILRYGEVEYEIEYTPKLEALLLSKLEEMRELTRTGEVHRNHNRKGKCRSCSRRKICPERIA